MWVHEAAVAEPQVLGDMISLSVEPCILLCSFFPDWMVFPQPRAPEHTQPGSPELKLGLSPGRRFLVWEQSLISRD